MGWIVLGNGIPFRMGGGKQWQTYWTPQKEPSDLIVTAQADTTIDFSWTAATDVEDGYKLKISTDGVTYTDKVTVDNATTTAQATGLTAGVLYYFKVVAYKGTNESSGTNVYDTRFKITINTTTGLPTYGSADDTFVIPTTGAGYNAYVDWGDGGAEQNITGTPGDVTHVYASSGTYQIKIRGTFPRIYFNGAGDRLKLITIDNWGNIKWTSFSDAFENCQTMTGNYIDVPNSSAVQSFAAMFRQCTAFNSSVNFDTSAATTMNGMFRSASAFNQPLSFDTSLVQSFSAMFYAALAFNQDISAFNLESATTLENMFKSSLVWSTLNYDNFLVSAAAQNVADSLSFHAGDAKYTESIADTGTTDGTTASKLVDSSQNFNTWVTVDDIVHNTTDDTYAIITAIDDDTTLSLSADIMVSGEDYVIQHDDAAKARAHLVLVHLWTITDGGPFAGFPGWGSLPGQISWGGNDSKELIPLDTPDGFDEVIQVTVLDTVVGFGGYRYWLADTPYHNFDTAYEKVCVWGSNDGIAFVEPAPGVNPIDPAINADPDLYYEGGVLYCVYTDQAGTAVKMRTSADGITWTDEITIASGTLGDALFTSPMLIKIGATYYLYYIAKVHDNTNVRRRSCATVDGSYNGAYETVPIPIIGSNDYTTYLWYHADIVYLDGFYWFVSTIMDAGLTGDLYILRSANGFDGWVMNDPDTPTFSTSNPPSEGDLYRSSMIKIGTKYYVYYNGKLSLKAYRNEVNLKLI